MQKIAPRAKWPIHLRSVDAAVSPFLPPFYNSPQQHMPRIPRAIRSLPTAISSTTKSQMRRDERRSQNASAAPTRPFRSGGGGLFALLSEALEERYTHTLSSNYWELQPSTQNTRCEWEPLQLQGPILLCSTPHSHLLGLHPIIGKRNWLRWSPPSPSPYGAKTL